MFSASKEKKYTFDNIVNDEFSSINKICVALKECAKHAHFALSTANSTSTYLYMKCVHGGKPRKVKSKAEKLRNCTSNKIGCEYICSASKDAKTGMWKTLSIDDPSEHSHPIAGDAYFYSSNRKPKTADQKRAIVEMMNSGIKDAPIARTMHAADVGMRPKDVANFRYYDIMTMLKGDFEIETLVLELQEKGYVVAYRYNQSHESQKKHLQAIFFTHKDSIELANKFNEVMTIDVTYRTVRMGLPLS